MTRLRGADRWVYVPGNVFRVNPGTFHDFLRDFVSHALGNEWAERELAKPQAERHPLMQWRAHLDRQIAQAWETSKGGSCVSPDWTANSAAFIEFAFHLFTVANCGLLEPRMVHRLRNVAGFRGARYEVLVRSVFLLAGFHLALENEVDERDSGHCEFEATYLPSGARYSVEAKSRHQTGRLGTPGVVVPESEIKLEFGKQLSKAFKKPAAHPRIIFIELDVPPAMNPLTNEAVWRGFTRKFENKENQRGPNGSKLPSCHLFLTHYPYHYVGEGDPPDVSVLCGGFNIAGYRELPDTERRERYPEIVALMGSLANDLVSCHFPGPQWI